MSDASNELLLDDFEAIDSMVIGEDALEEQLVNINPEARKKIEAYFDSQSFENQSCDEDYLDKYYDFDDI